MKIDKKIIKELSDYLDEFNLTELEYTEKDTKIKVSKNNISVKKKMKEYQKFIKKNFEYVGENFAYKARSIHYDKKKPKKGIYGSASVKDVKELRDEGIETDIIPWIEDDKN